MSNNGKKDHEDLAFEAKNKGNEFYKKRNFKEAIECYTKAIHYDGKKASFFSNRSAAHFETGFYEGAIHDCLAAEELAQKDDALKSKIMLRRAKCLVFLGELEDAKAAIVLMPKMSSEAKRVLKSIDKRLEEKLKGPERFPSYMRDFAFEVNPTKAMRTLSRTRAMLQSSASFEMFPLYDPFSMLEKIPGAASPDLIDHKYLLRREQSNKPIRVVLSGIGDGRLIFSTLTNFDMIMEKHEYEDKRTKTAMEIVIYEEDPAVIARNMVIFDCILSFCKIIVENREMSMDQLKQSEPSDITLQEATYLSHLYFGCKLPTSFADSLRDSLDKGVGKGMTQQEVLAWALISPTDWLSVKMVMKLWASSEDSLGIEDVDEEVNTSFEHLYTSDWIRSCAIRKQTATLNELQEVADSSEYLEAVYNSHKLSDRVPQDMDPQAYIQHLIKQVQETPIDEVEPRNWPLRGCTNERNMFIKTKRFSVPPRIRSAVLVEEEEDEDLEYEVNPTMTNPLDNMFPADRLRGYVNPWEVAEQLICTKLLMRDYAHSRATLNQPFVFQNYEVNLSMSTFSEDMYHFWRLLSLRFHRCLVSRRVRLRFVMGTVDAHARTSSNSIPHKIESFDRMVFSGMLHRHGYLNVLTTAERIVRSKCLDGIYCILSPNKAESYDDLGDLLQSQLSVSSDLLFPTLTHLYRVKLVKGLVDTPHVFVPIHHNRDEHQRKAFWMFYFKRMKEYYDSLNGTVADLSETMQRIHSNSTHRIRYAVENDDHVTSADQGKKPKNGNSNSKKKGGGGRKKRKHQRGKKGNNHNHSNDENHVNGKNNTTQQNSNGNSEWNCADEFNSFSMPDHPYFTEPNTTAYLTQLLMQCAFPLQGDHVNNLAAWFHFVAKLCEESIVPKHWVALLIDQITSFPNVVTTTAHPDQEHVTKASPSRKLCMRPIMSEFYALLRLWLSKIPCFDAFNAVQGRHIARVFFNFKEFDILMRDGEVGAPLGLIVFTSDMQIWAANPNQTDLKSLMFNQIFSLPTTKDGQFPYPSSANSSSTLTTSTATQSTSTTSLTTSETKEGKRRHSGDPAEENGFFPNGSSSTSTTSDANMFGGPQLYSCLKVEGDVVSCVMLFPEFIRISREPKNTYGALIRMDTWDVLHMHGRLIPPQAYC
eukprot:m.18795 g.18795  ORF g.18795 m.18795 type:complete len:1151 (-) comp8363_c0_seq1:149-3601(-)